MTYHGTLATPKGLQDAILSHLTTRSARIPPTATVHDWAHGAVVCRGRDRIVDSWFFSNPLRLRGRGELKRVYYLSMEFLIGRLLGELAAVKPLRLDTEGEGGDIEGLDLELRPPCCTIRTRRGRWETAASGGLAGPG